MLNYEEMYYKLFAETENALVELEQQNYGKAIKILIAAQRTAEEAFLADTDEDVT